jgi:hypothetical protein
MAANSKVIDMYGLRQVQAHKFNLNQSLKEKIASLPKVESNHVIGIEVEVEAVQASGISLMNAWYTEADGSLRNNGIEFITHPIEAMYAPFALNHLMNDYMTTQSCFSPRTSVHVHLNAQDMTHEQVLNLVIVYSLWERLLFQFAGRGRMKNVYCVPLTECSLLNNLVSKGSFNERNWSKYTSLNLLPLGSHGTLEFRHMHGSRDVEKLSTWINLICKLKDYVLKNDTKTIRSMVGSMDDGFPFEDLMKDVFGEFTKVLKYNSSDDIPYLEVKDALIPLAAHQAIAKLNTNQSEFFTFKGQ